jgi:hypothetical protein
MNRWLEWGRADGVMMLSLVGLAVILFWRLALTELIIARGDLFFYFYPYRDFASEAVQAGRVPLWNPYLFMGVPFLANSQAGFFYPLNLVLAWLPVERMVSAGIVLHVALAALGGYLWGRGGLGLGRAGAWLTGLGYGLGGYFVAQVEHLNQAQALAWLPWLLWLYDGHASREMSFSRPLGSAWRFVGLTLVIALQFLAGHTQSVFICVVGLAVYAVTPVGWELARRQAGWRELVRLLGVVAGAALLGGALAAVQLVPTLELSQLSVRSGGLPYREAVSFSLRPGLVGRALLPGWGAPLFPEFVAYIGVAGLALAVVGAWGEFAGGGEKEPRLRSGRGMQRARRGAVVLVIVGLLLALGGFNPFYFLLVKLVPGFGLFRVPARWLVLYAVGVAGSAGLGLDRLGAERGTRTGWSGRGWWAGLALAGALLAALVLLGQGLGGAEPDLAPPLELSSLVGWLVVVLAFGMVLYLGRTSLKSRPSSALITLFVILVTVELLGASIFLPLNRATAPGALTDLRPAVAHLLGEAQATQPEPAGRFLSISDISFDPGDKQEIEIALGPQLSSEALYDYIIATKQKEVLIPNLPLYYRLPTVDGYDGGVLPLRRYVTLERLYMPAEQVAIDGRLRENLKSVPEGRWLSLFNVRFVITDKVSDAWFDDVFYDLQMGATLGSGDEAGVGYLPAAEATALGVVYRADGAVEGTSLATVELRFADGRELSLVLAADAAGAGERVARLSWGEVARASAVTVRGMWREGDVTIRGLSLIDERTGVFWPLVLSDSGHYRLVHSGDVKIYENLDALPRAFFVPEAILVPGDDAALETMRDPNFDPASTLVLIEAAASAHNSQPTPRLAEGNAVEDQASAELVLYEPERIIVNVSAPTQGWLLLSDAWYPGWEATVDGKSAPVQRADVLFRAVAVPEGEHQVQWVFRPASFRLGVAISLGTVGLLLAGVVWAGLRRMWSIRRARQAS